MTDLYDRWPPEWDVLEFCQHWYKGGVCPGCLAFLPDVAGQGAGHSAVTGEIRGGGPRGDMCSWSADDLTMLVHIGSGLVKYDRGTGGSNRPPAGETAPSRETAPTRLLR